MTVRGVKSIAVIGGGFSGTLMALHLLDHCSEIRRVSLIERDRSFGRGVAYSSANPSHLLNARVGRMSAFPDRPEHFLDWLNQRATGSGGPSVDSHSFVPRHVFGAYIRGLLSERVRDLGRRDRLALVTGQVTDLVHRDGERGITPIIDGVPSEPVDAVVLALGNFPPDPPPVADSAFYDTTRY